MNWKKWFLLPGPLVALLAVGSALGLGLVFFNGLEQTLLAYGIFALSFYGLCVLCLWCAFRLPRLWKGIRGRLEANRLAARYLHDPIFHARVSLGRSLAVNLLFALVHVLSWYLSGSAWYGILAAYYAILALLRFLLLGPVRRGSFAQQSRRARLCGWLLLLLNFTLSAAVLMILYQGKGYHYQGILIYVMAMYTFYTVIHAIVEILRSRKAESPAMNAAKAVSLCAALVSLLNLETAMFAQFGQDMPIESQHFMVMLTGAGVSIGMIALSLWVITRRNDGK